MDRTKYLSPTGNQVARGAIEAKMDIGLYSVYTNSRYGR